MLAVLPRSRVVIALVAALAGCPVVVR